MVPFSDPRDSRQPCLSGVRVWGKQEKYEVLVDPDDVAVLYVDLDEEQQQATISRLRLDRRGRWLDRWPGGFFDERFARGEITHEEYRERRRQLE